MGRRWLFALGVPVLLLAVYKLMYPTYSWRQKMTVELLVGDEVITSSSISEVSVKFQPAVLSEIGHITSSIRGEAVALKIQERGYLFALLATRDGDVEWPKWAVLTIFRDLLPNEDLRSQLKKISSVRMSRELPVDDYPMFVSFEDVGDPTTIRIVDIDDLDAVFGSDVELRKVYLSLTDEPVPKGSLDNILPWLKWSREKLLEAGDGTGPMKVPDSSPKGYFTIGITDFVKGMR